MHPDGASRLVTLAPRLREAFLSQRYDADTLMEVLGDDGHDALGRGEPVPVRRAAAGAGLTGTLIRLLLTGDDCPRSEAAAALAPVDVDEAVAAGLLEVAGDRVRAALDVRPMDLGAGNRWMISDLDGSMRPRDTAPDHVLGVGHASLSLLRATPTARTGSVLDVGTGCGVQAAHAAGYARSVTATDVSARALEFAAAGCALNETPVEFLRGPWYEPAAGRTFDRIVANPPFVVGRGTVDHTYRDSGLPLDGASETMISGALAHLAPGGVATMLASWVHLRDEDWRSRVAGWLPDDGLEAWVVQRDVADPALYVGTWMRDAGLDPRDPANAALADDWLEHFARAGVEGVGFGFVYLQRTDAPTSVTAEDLRHGFDDPLGDEALDQLARAAWLRSADVADARFRFDPATALERVLLPTASASVAAAGSADAPEADEATWREVVTRLHRGGGPRWQHEVDEASLQLLTGLGRGELTTAQVAGLLATARGADAAALTAEATELVVGLIRHGLLRPVAGNS
ncbi:methyltransferase [Tomitella fengzijianii]|uniref:Methyltransferase n=2 Tax=Tomitella fengzijianii TaxID=2597660 RepID=A0A516X976_9ACTN|nr:methyltransferase [Tomitella fengzijianii]QDQ99231.1 methyltransferase [Tomitella fengzijianii]